MWGYQVRGRLSLKFFLITLFLASILGGCCLIPEYEPLMNLKNLGDDRTRSAEYIKEQEGLYNKLGLDIKEERLKKGTPKKEIFSEYGQPIFSRAIKDESQIKLALIYRHPTRFFSSDMLYLYFDDKDNLCSWEIKPASLDKEDTQR